MNDNIPTSNKNARKVFADTSRITDPFLQPSSLDLSFFHIESQERPQVISAVACIKKIINPDNLKSEIITTIKDYNRLLSEFINNKHIINSEKQFYFNFSCIDLYEQSTVTKIISELMIANNLAQNKLWAVFLIRDHILNISYVIYKLHHSLADGVSGLGFFHNLILKKQSNQSRILKSANNIKKILSFKTLLSLINVASLKNTKLTLLPEGLERTIIFKSISINNYNQIKKNLNATSHSLSLYVASRIYSIIFPNQKIFRALVPVAIDSKTIYGRLGNFIGGTSIEIKLDQTCFKSKIEEIKEELNKKINISYYSAYYTFAKILNHLPKKIPKKLSKHSASKIDAIVTSLNGPKQIETKFNADLIHEYAIPALMPGQHIGFGFIKNKNSMDITIILDKNLIVDINNLDLEINKAIQMAY